MKLIDSSFSFFDFFNSRSGVPKLVHCEGFGDSAGWWSFDVPKELRPEGIKMAYFGHVEFDWDRDTVNVNICKWVWEKFPIRAIFDEYELASGMTVRLRLDRDS